MEFGDADDLADTIKIQLSSLSSLLTTDGYELVCEQAGQELGWSYPVTNPAKVYWLTQRGTRHAINVLRIAAAYKFKYKQVNLQHRFEHFQKLIDMMDAEFAAAMASDIGLFADGFVSSADSYKMFGTKIDAGFAYGVDGKDLTYELDRYVNFSPIEDA
jgi:hypothetical protein